MPLHEQPDLDRPIWGARDIAIAAGILDKRGRPHMRRVYYLLEKQYLPATKIGRAYTSTIRRLRSIANGATTE